MIRHVTANLRKQVGVTMIELIIVMAIIGLLAAIAVPNIMEFIKTSRVSAQTDALVNTFALARLKAITEREDIVVCAADDPDNSTACIDTDKWSNGWIVFSKKVVAGGDKLTPMSRIKANANSVEISFVSNDFKKVTFSKTLGSASVDGGGEIGVFKFCGVKLGHKEQLVTLSTSGRAAKTVSAKNCDN